MIARWRTGMRVFGDLSLWLLVLLGVGLPAFAFAQSRTTTIVQKPPPTCQISVTPSSITIGGTVTVKWTSTNATGGAITNVGNVGPSGSIQLLPSSATRTTYYGAFTGPGGTANCQASVVVQVPTGGGTGGTQTQTTEDVVPVQTPAPSTVAAPSIIGSGLVPCGYGSFNPANTVDSSTGCQACSLAQLVQNVINFLIGITIPLAAALFAYAGWLYFTSATNPGNIGKAKDIFKRVLLGFLLAVSAWLIVNTILHVIFSQGQFANGSWFTIQCVSGDSREVNGKIGTLLSQIPILNGGAPITGSGNIYTGGVPGSEGGGGTNPTSASLYDQVTEALVAQCAVNDAASCSALDSIQNGTQVNDQALEALANNCEQNNDQASCNALLRVQNPDAVGGRAINPQMASQLAAACSQYNVDCTFAQSIARNESAGGSNCSTSPTGAAGCMQVLATTACSMDTSIDYNCSACLASRNSTSAACAPVIENIRNNPQLGVDLGVRYIGQLQNDPKLIALEQTYGTCQITAAAYYQGPGAVRQYGGIPPNAVNYVRQACGSI